MGLDRCYCPGFDVGQACHLEGDEARHLARVRRVAVGAEVEVFDGRGRAAVAEVVEIGRDRVDLIPRREVAGRQPPRLRLILATAIPKGDRFDWLIEKATELGVERVVPLVTGRSTVDPRSTKLDRLRRAIVEACKQSRRDALLAIDEPIRWDRWLEGLDPAIGHRRIAHPGGGSLRDLAHDPSGGPVIVAIGPEGGWTDEEVDLAGREGFTSIHLTPTILRIETACIAAAARLLI